MKRDRRPYAVRLRERLVEAIETLAGRPPSVRHFGDGYFPAHVGDHGGYSAFVVTRDGSEAVSSMYCCDSALDALTSLLDDLVSREGSEDVNYRLYSIPVFVVGAKVAHQLLRLVPEVQAYMAARALGAT